MRIHDAGSDNKGGRATNDTDTDTTSPRHIFAEGMALAGLAAAAPCSRALFAHSPAGADGCGADDPAAETTTWGHCAINCPGRCSLRFHVRDGEVVWVDTYSTSDAGDDFDSLQPRACLKGRSYRWWLNHADRLSYPMKRTEGTARGEGVFERIGWDEAIRIAATKLREVIDTYGNEAVYVAYATGVSCTTARPFNRLLNCLGGHLNRYGDYSAAQISFITPFIYGSSGEASSLSAAENAALVLVFGSSPTETRQGGLTSHYDWVHLRERTGARIYFFDCRMNDSIMGHSECWVPINPGTDAAFVAAVAHELIEDDLIDLDFLHTYCVGFDEETMPRGYRGQNLSFRSYIMGEGYDLVEKTPEWAAPITGISPGRIRELAREIGTAKPLYVNQGWGPQRRSNGEWTSWAIMALPCLVGQVGLPGTSNGAREACQAPPLGSLAAGENPVAASIPCFMFTDAIRRGAEMTAATDGVRHADRLNVGIKYMINYAGNCLTNQHGDVNAAHEILADDTACEFILGIDTAMTDSLYYCDVILPDLFRFEQTSQIAAGGDHGYIVTGTAATAPKFERKTAYEMAALLAAALGVEEEFTEGKTEEEHIKEIYAAYRETDAALPTWDEMVERGVYTIEREPSIALRAFREDPQANPLDTPSGKIELFSSALIDYTRGWVFSKGDMLGNAATVTPIPAYIPEWYGVGTTTEEYPLMLAGFHCRARIHSSWGFIDELKEVNPQEAWINPVDAQARGIAQGDTVRVVNDFGAIELVAKVTPRVVPGTVAVSQGAWYDGDRKGGVDAGGCFNTMTTQRPSPLAKGNPQHTNICQVERA